MPLPYVGFTENEIGILIPRSCIFYYRRCNRRKSYLTLKHFDIIEHHEEYHQV